MVRVAVYDPLSVPVQAPGQVGCIGGDHDSPVWVPAQVMRWEATRDQLALPMPWRREDHKPLNLAPLDAVEVARDQRVVPVGVVPREGVPREVD